MGMHSREVGLNFGLTSAVITTLGLIVGLEATTNSQTAVLGGILIIAIADAFSDAFGIHMSEESEGVHTKEEVWEATASTFISKFLFALTFAIPFLFASDTISLQNAVLIASAWGLLLLCFFSYRMAKMTHQKTLHVIAEHLVIAVIVIVLTHFIGAWIRELSGNE
ncbi:MAG: hypothetical protein QXF35_04495 [Candidatus Bilamarchaeaceae archaeon]